MKFIHCSDLHIDSALEGFPTEKSKIRREEVLATFERLLSFAKQNQVQAVIIAGDMFDTAKVSVKTIKRVIHAIENCGADVLCLTGNHDEENLLSSIENPPKNLKFFGDNWTNFYYGDTVICGAKLTHGNQDFLYESLSLNASEKNVVVLHGQIVGYNGKEQAENISLPRLKDKNIDYLALGHIHSYSEGVLDNRAKYVYCGCLEGRGFDEVGEKGFCLVHTDGEVRNTFVPFSSRNLYTVQYDVSERTDWLKTERNIISDLVMKYDKNSLIKVVLVGSNTVDYGIDLSHFTKQLNDLFFFAKVYNKTTVKFNESDINDDKSIRGEFIRTVLQSDLSEEEQSKIITCGLNALKGEELL